MCVPLDKYDVLFMPYLSINRSLNQSAGLSSYPHMFFVMQTTFLLQELYSIAENQCIGLTLVCAVRVARG
jgi:hypothetical protein